MLHKLALNFSNRDNVRWILVNLLLSIFGLFFLALNWKLMKKKTLWELQSSQRESKQFLIVFRFLSIVFVTASVVYFYHHNKWQTFNHCFPSWTWNSIRSEMEKSFVVTDLTLEQMSNSSWVTEYGENLKESVSSNLS